MDLTWRAPAYDGTITGWELRYGELPDLQSVEVVWGEWAAIEGATAETASHTVTGLVNGTFYAFELRALAGELVGEASVTAVTSPMAMPGPDALGALALDGLALEPRFEPLVTAYTAAAAADQARTTVTAAALDGTSSVAIAPGDADAATAATRWRWPRARPR